MMGGENVGFRSYQVRLGDAVDGMTIELLEPWHPERFDFLERFVARHGAGPHHLTFKVVGPRRDPRPGPDVRVHAGRHLARRPALEGGVPPTARGARHRRAARPGRVAVPRLRGGVRARPHERSERRARLVARPAGSGPDHHDPAPRRHDDAERRRRARLLRRAARRRDRRRRRDGRRWRVDRVALAGFGTHPPRGGPRTRLPASPASSSSAPAPIASSRLRGRAWSCGTPTVSRRPISRRVDGGAPIDQPTSTPRSPEPTITKNSGSVTSPNDEVDLRVLEVGEREDHHDQDDDPDHDLAPGRPEAVRAAGRPAISTLVHWPPPPCWLAPRYRSGSGGERTDGGRSRETSSIRLSRTARSASER